MCLRRLKSCQNFYSAQNLAKDKDRDQDLACSSLTPECSFDM